MTIPTLTDPPRKITVQRVSRRDIRHAPGSIILGAIVFAFLCFAVAGFLVGFLSAKP